jgi:hypothetical protein
MTIALPTCERVYNVACRNRQFWLISGAFCLSLGVFEVWDVILDVNLNTLGISQVI